MKRTLELVSISPAHLNAKRSSGHQKARNFKIFSDYFSCPWIAPDPDL
jgi:hypothetical protein